MSERKIGDHMKIKSIFIKLFIIIFIILIIIFNVYILIYKNKKSNNNDDIKKIFSNEKVEVSEKEKYLFEKLMNKGMDIYNSKEYLNFEKLHDIYFISLDSLNANYDFDISEFIVNEKYCNVLDSGIYFDINNKIQNNKSSTSYVVPVLIDCGKTEEDN